MKKVFAIKLFMLLTLIGAPMATYGADATVDDLYNAVTELIGPDSYVYFDHTGTQYEVDGYRAKSFGVNGDLTDSGGGHGWTENAEFAESLTGLMGSAEYNLYVIAIGRSDSDGWGVRVGFESLNYSLSALDIGHDDTLTKYNLGLYQNADEAYPFRENSGSSTQACMHAVYVGTFTADASGNATIYVDNVNEVQIGDVIGDRTMYDGLLVAPVQASDPVPANEATYVELDTDLSWTSPGEGYAFDVYFGTEEPNAMQTNYGPTFTKVTSVPQTETTVEIPTALDYSTDYYWVVETYAPGSTEVLASNYWMFTTEPYDSAPAVTAGSSYITWLDNLAQGVDAVVDDNGENDVADSDVVWTIDTYAGDPVSGSGRAFDRGMTSANAVTLSEQGYDPNILSDWVGCDARTDNKGNPIVFVISGLPAGEYTWTSMHHDYNDQTGLFDVYVDGALAAADVDMTSGTQTPAEFTTTITSDGSTPVKVLFKEVSITGSGIGIFGINALKLSDDNNALNIDFGTAASSVAVGYEAYTAADKDLASFSAQDFAFGSATVTIDAEFGPLAAGWIDASITKTSTDPLAPTATFTTNYPGTYVLKVSATDDTVFGPEALVGSATLEVQVAEDACAAAQLSDNWDGFDFYDVDSNCVINVSDFAAFAATWLDFTSMTEAEAY